MAPNPATALDGLTAVVTGAASGIGRAIALEFAGAGADCLIHTRRNLAGGQAVADEAIRLGRKSQVLLADLANPADQDAFATAAWSWQNKIDIWVNNAGADTLTGAAAAWNFEQKLNALWQVDVVASMRLSRAIGAQMKQQGRGTIINIGWDRADYGMAGDSGELFAATKGAVMSFTRSLARSLAPRVRVNCIAPGWIKTSWGENASEYWQQRASAESLLGRWGDANDVAKLANFLASPAAAFITGQVIAVNGGLQ